MATALHLGCGPLGILDLLGSAVGPAGLSLFVLLRAAGHRHQARPGTYVIHPFLFRARL